MIIADDVPPPGPAADVNVTTCDPPGILLAVRKGALGVVRLIRTMNPNQDR